MNNYDYPAGADNRDAPWNEPDSPKEATFDILISQTLSRSTTITTSDYTIEGEQDEDGYCEMIDTTETNWKAPYKEQRMTPLELIGELKSLLEKALPDPTTHPKEYNKAKYLIEECEGWIEDDFEVIEN